MKKVTQTINEMLKPTKGKGLFKRQWIVKKNGTPFTITVTKGDMLNREGVGK